MTIKEASRKFNLDEKEIRNRKDAGMIIGIHKDGRNIVIPDETEIIPSKKDIQSFLLQILRQRNNVNTVISRKLCPDKSTLDSLMRYLYKRGFIGRYDETSADIDLIAKVQLTDEGIAYILGNKNYISISNAISVPLTVNVNIASIAV